MHARYVPLKYNAVDLGGSLAVASKGLYSTGVSTDLCGASIFPGSLRPKLIKAKWRTWTRAGKLATNFEQLFSAISVNQPVNPRKYPIPGGMQLTAKLPCDLVGRSLAYTSIQFTNSKGELAARGSHTKFVSYRNYGRGFLANKLDISLLLGRIRTTLLMNSRGSKAAVPPEMANTSGSLRRFPVGADMYRTWFIDC